MPLSRCFRESAVFVRGKMRMAVITGELIYANVRLLLTANRTYGLQLILQSYFKDRFYTRHKVRFQH